MTSQGAKPQLVVTDRQSILERARERKHGKWIERILIQCRKTLTGVGFKEFKDISEQIRNLPKQHFNPADVGVFAEFLWSSGKP